MRTFGFVTTETQVVCLQIHTTPKAVNRGRYLESNLMEDSQNSEEKCKHPWRQQVCDLALHLVTLSPSKKVRGEPTTSMKHLLYARGEMVKDIRKYFSEEEWANMGKSEKLTYVSMKKSYEIMTSLGLTAKLPDFMRPKNRATEFPEHNSDEAQNPGNQGIRKEKTNVWAHRLRERKYHIVYEEISDPEEDD
ncbi:PREDICTED: LOW QUALITY PROTEIN: protein SSX3-like [Miniopterus natalensis]|uniref:LOW QUALITY PROTEIN: protein SSX3-like n=1 Tax=Miniopterus natalensis TaxID=291302 RepID=UPI0007A6F999|nr:PREDICTED: LOW QUALITY PROTEIN: protein SSX3-like [Miniopterus natalensis]